LATKKNAAITAAEKTYGKKPIVELGSPGTGPLYLFTRGYNASAISIGVSSTDSGMHAPNEHVRLDYFEKGIIWFARTIETYLT
jgi:acetylornithine deacetylase/succinyl-diaminopimelate desuccinylase-like protein